MKKVMFSWTGTTFVLAFVILVQGGLPSLAQEASREILSPPSTQTAQGTPAQVDDACRPDMVLAVKSAAAKDCGCKSCAAKGCEPCHGKNCYFCVAKALMTTECGCGMCDAKGCDFCGPGCDVCKFHLAPVAEAEAPAQKQEK